MSTRPPNPLGPEVDPTPRPLPTNDQPLTGRFVQLVALRPEHADALYPQISGDEHAYLWDYMLDGPYHDLPTFKSHITAKSTSTDPLFYTIISNPNSNSNPDSDIDASVPETQRVLGLASYLRINPTHATIEVGNLMFPPRLARTPHATEAMYLMAKHAFEDLGYRRYEWKCHALNAPSNRAAKRLGFVFEGVFRRHFVVKGRSRDTAWYSITEEEWPARKAEMEGWLEGGNFDEGGVQRRRLEEFRME